MQIEYLRVQLSNQACALLIYKAVRSGLSVSQSLLRQAQDRPELLKTADIRYILLQYVIIHNSNKTNIYNT